MSQGSMGSFSSQGIRPSNTASYYLPANITTPPAPTTAIVVPPSNPEAVFYNAQGPYYSLYTGVTVPPSPAPPSSSPLPNVVPNPVANSTNSKAFAVNKLGGASVPISASSNFAIDGPIQYQNSPDVGISYFIGVAGNPPPAPAPLPPDIFGISSSGFTAFFSIAGITGIGTLSYFIRYNKVGSTTSVSVPVTRASPTLSIYVATITGLDANSQYNVYAVATDVGGSAVSAATLTTTLPAGGTAPTGTIGPPTLVSKTSTSITVSVNTTTITSTPFPEIYILYGTNPTSPNVPSSVSTNAAGIYTFVVTGLNPSTAYAFRSVATTGVAPDLTALQSAAITTDAAPPIPALTTNVVLPFLIQGPRFGSAYSAALDYYLNVGGVGCTLAVGATAIAGTQLFGSLFAGSQVTGGATTNAGKAISDQPYNETYGGVTDAYFESVGTTQTRRIISWGGFYADVLGLFGPYQPVGFPGTNPTSANVVDSICHTYLGISGAANPLSWSSSGWSTVFDGVILDFENVGLGGRPTTNQYPLPQSPVPSFPADATDVKYVPYLAAIAGIPQEFYAKAPTKYIANAPVSLSINADLLNGKNNGNIGAANSGLNTWFAFPNSSTVPSAATFNNTPVSALNHPNFMSYFDDIFVQFYNEDQAYYPGGQYFPNLLAQWGYVALLAQLKGNKNPRINIGLAKGNIIPGYPPEGGAAVAAVQGPTPPLDSEALNGPPYTYWYPQYCTPQPPNAKTGQTQNWPDTGIAEDPINIARAISEANSILQQSFANPNLKPSDWCSGMGFWAATAATAMAQSVYDNTNPFSPGNILPAINTYCWSEASYPAPDPDWPTNVPIVSNLVPPLPPS